jgi:hypothetical protein
MVMLLLAYAWKAFDPDNNIAFIVHFSGWLASLLAAGYFSTPSNSTIGKVAFGFVILIVAGIAMKILHLTGANNIIISGLAGIFITYAVMWFREKRTF